MELKKRGYKVALASSTGPKLIARIMEETGMRPVFDLIVSGGQFKQSKPNPEIYHYTAKTLGSRKRSALWWRIPRWGSRQERRPG